MQEKAPGSCIYLNVAAPVYTYRQSASTAQSWTSGHVLFVATSDVPLLKQHYVHLSGYFGAFFVMRAAGTLGSTLFFTSSQTTLLFFSVSTSGEKIPAAGAGVLTSSISAL